MQLTLGGPYIFAELARDLDYGIVSCVPLRDSRPFLPAATATTVSSMSFVGGKLKLKGGDPLKGGVKKKKKKPSNAELALANAEDGGEGEDKAATAAEPTKTRDGYILPTPAATADRRTEAEKRHEERLRKLEEERLRKQAGKGYRDRVKDFNERLANLSEHHDIPKVGPG